MNLTDITLILIVALILFGPEDLPSIAKTIGRVVFQVRQMSNDLGRQFQEAINTPTSIINDSLQDTSDRSEKKSNKEAKEAETAQDSVELLSYGEKTFSDSSLVDNEPKNNSL